MTKYYRVTVKMTTGFTYSYTCIEKLLPGMKKSSEGYWTESIEVQETTKEDHEKTWGVGILEPETKTKTKKVPKATKKDTVESKKPKKGKQYPQFSNIEDFLKD